MRGAITTSSGSKKKAEQQKAHLVFEDKSGFMLSITLLIVQKDAYLSEKREDIHGYQSAYRAVAGLGRIPGALCSPLPALGRP